MPSIIKGSYRVSYASTPNAGLYMLEFAVFGEKSYIGHPSLFSVEASSPLSGPGYVNVFFKDKLIYSYTTDSPTHPSGCSTKAVFYEKICNALTAPSELSEYTNIFIALPD